MSSATITPDPLAAAIRTIPDYPKPGIQFRDITTLLVGRRRLSPVGRASLRAVSGGADRQGRGDRGAWLHPRRGDGAGARRGFVPIRKRGKLPHATVSVEYALEYGVDAIEMHADAIVPGERVLVADDIIATGGTADAAINCCGSWVPTSSVPPSSSICPSSAVHGGSKRSASRFTA